MRLIGHVSTAVLVAAPLILHREKVPVLAAPGLSDVQLLWWVGLFAALPDLDIVLQRWLPIKHRGFASHSLFTAILVAATLAAAHVTALVRPAWLPAAVAAWLAPAALWLSPGAIALALVGVLAHLLGDSFTKTGVPLCYPGQAWTFPLLGGRVAFDNPVLNAIPLLAAVWVLAAWFHLDGEILGRLGHWRSVLRL